MLERILRSFVPTRVKHWVRRYARLAVGYGGDDALTARDHNIFQLLDQKIEHLDKKILQEAVERDNNMLQALDHRLQNLEARVDSLSYKADHANESHIDTMAQSLDQHVRRLESRINTLDRSVSGYGDAPNAAQSEGAGQTGHDVAPTLLDPQQYMVLEETAHRSGTDRKAVTDAYGWLLDTLFPSAPTVIDLGCGDGAFLETLADHGGEGVGVDINEEALKPPRARGLKVECADLLEYLGRQPPASVDAVTAFHVIEHLSLDYLARTLTEAYRVLRPGGLLVMETPKVASLYTLTQYYFVDPTHQPPRHHKFYKHVIDNTGFADSRVDDIPQTGDTERIDTPGLRSMVEARVAQADGATTDPALWEAVTNRFAAIEDWLMVPRAVRLVAFKPDTAVTPA